MSFQIKLVNKQGIDSKTVSVFDTLTEYTVRETLLAQVIRSEQLSLRAGNAHTKDRGDVRGGGKKPWKQKGTGRARHGSTRSPIWVGGGVTFGPRNVRNWHRDINKSARVAALKSILKDRLVDNHVYSLEDSFDFNKTKDVVVMLDVLSKDSNVKTKTSILVYTAEDKDNIKGFLNTEIKMINASNLKIFKLANAELFLLTPKSIALLEARITK